MMKWIKRFYCKHQWITVFRGQFTRGVICRKCEKEELLSDFNSGAEAIGWIEPHGTVEDKVIE